jgi:hypothetical protein
MIAGIHLRIGVSAAARDAKDHKSSTGDRKSKIPFRGAKE